MSVPEGLDALLEIEQIKQTKYRYLRCVDTKDWPGLAGCLTADAESRYGDSAEVCDGAGAIADYVAANLPAGVSSAHTLTQPEIRLTSASTADGSWMLSDVIVDPGRELVYRGAARYADEYRKVGGQWLIHRTGFLRLYEEAQVVGSGSRSFGAAPGAWLRRAATGLHVDPSDLG